MTDKGKTKPELIAELQALRLRVAELEQSETERQQIEESLRQSESFITTMFDGIADFFSVQDADYNIIKTSKAMEQVFGKDIVGKKCYQTYEGRNEVCPDCPVVKAWNTGKTAFSAERVSQSGRVVEIWAFPMKDAQGHITAVIEHGRDITKRKRAEESLRKNEELYRSLFENMLNGYAYCRMLFEDGQPQDFVYLEVNAKFEELTGLHDVIGKKVTEVIPGIREANPEMFAMYGRVSLTGKPEKFETYLPALDMWFSVSVYSPQKEHFIAVFDVITERKRAEESLRKSEEKYRTLVDNAPVGIYRTNIKGDFLYVNDTLVKMHGFDSAEEMMAGGALSRYKNKNDRGFFLKELAEKGKVNNLELELLTKTGKVMAVIMNAVLEGDTLSGMLIDITQRKQAEQLFQSMFDSLPIGIYIVQEGKLRLVNPAILKLTGYSEADVLGKESLSFVLNEDREMVRDYAVQMLRGERAFPYEHRLVDKEGKVRWVMETVTPIQYQGKRAVLGNYMDITDHKQAEKAFEAQKALTDRILASTPNAILVIDRDLEIVLANQMFTKVFNLTKEKAEGKPLKDVLHVDGLLEAISRTLADQQFQSSMEFRYEVESGEIILSTQIVPMAAEEVLLILRDVTVEHARQGRQYHLDRLASIGEVAAGVAHELNNPLASVLGYSELLLSSNVSQEVRSDLEVVHSNAQRAVTIVHKMLSFARHQEPQQQLININDTIRYVLEMRDYEFRVNNIEAITELADELPDVLADRQQLEQVFLNIVLNAEQAMVKAHNQGCLTARTEVRRGMVRVVLSDDGPGIPEENLWRVFDPFFTTKEPGKGTGLGLSICHSIVTAHGGRIYAESKVGQGATFVVELPVAEAEAVTVKIAEG